MADDISTSSLAPAPSNLSVSGEIKEDTQVAKSPSDSNVTTNPPHSANHSILNALLDDEKKEEQLPKVEGYICKFS